MGQCNDSTDVSAQIFYDRGNFIIDQTGLFDIALLPKYMSEVSKVGEIDWIETYGPHGTTTYEGPNYQNYFKDGGAPPGKPVGTIDGGGGISCFGPIPCPTGTHWDLTLERCVGDNVLVIPPQPPPPPPTPECPPGFTWDPATETCVIDLGGGGGGTIGGGGGGGGGQPPPLPPPPPPPKKDGDQLAECCAETAEYLYSIAQQLQYLARELGQGNNSTCCETVAATIGSITLALDALTGAVSKLGPPTDPVTCAQLKQNNNNLMAAQTNIGAAIVTALSGGTAPTPDPNVKRIADTLNGFPPDSADAQAKVAALIKLAVGSYGFPADIAQLLTT
jgi:hypothetical protein